MNLFKKLEQKIDNLGRHVRWVIALSCAIAIFISFNIISTIYIKGFQKDLTEEKLYTLSPVTTEVLKSIDEPLTVTLYFSEALGDINPLLSDYASRITELLERYSESSNHMLKIEIENPEPFSKAEDMAIALGLRGIPLSDSQTNLYFGLVINNMASGQKVVPFLDPAKEKYIEYDLTKIISDLIRTTRKTVGIMTSLPIDGRGSDADLTFRNKLPRWAIMDNIRQIFDVKYISMNTGEIPDNIDVLMIVNPKRIIIPTMYAIDQYIMRGGRVLLFLDTYSEAEALYRNYAPTVEPDMDKLLNNWGISIHKEKTLGDSLLARSVTINDKTSQKIIKYLPWLNISSDYINKSDVATSSIETINMGTASVIEVNSGFGPYTTPLIQSSQNSGEIDAGLIRVQSSPNELLSIFKPDAPYSLLAVRINAMLHSAFEAEPPRIISQSSKHPYKDKSDVLSNIIVVADSDMLYDQFWTEAQNNFGEISQTAFAGNGDFVINALDNLSGSESLISLRGRGKWHRPFTLIDNIRANAEANLADTEREVTEQLIKTQSSLNKLMSRSSTKEKDVLTQDEITELSKLKSEIVPLRIKLKNVKLALRKDIEDVQNIIEDINITLPALLVILFGFTNLYLRKRRNHLKRNKNYYRNILRKYLTNDSSNNKEVK